MAEFQELLDFPPAPKLNLLGKLDATKSTSVELRGQDFGPMSDEFDRGVIFKECLRERILA